MIVSPESRLFIPLSREPFKDFKNYGKIWEIRRYGRNFTEKTVFPNRPVELRLGYSTPQRLYGVVGEVIVGTLQEIFERVPLHLIEPRCNTIEQAMNDNENLLHKADKYIAWENRNLRAAIINS